MKFVGLTKLLTEIQTVAHNSITFPHIIFKGPRGSGKTVLARHLAQVAGKRLIELNAPALDKQKIYQVLVSLRAGDILFIDEIHRLSPAVEEILYQPMESSTLTIPVRNRLQTFPFPKFTLVGATTRPGLISKPLMSRFRLQIDIPRYNLRELTRIVMQEYAFTRRECLEIARLVMVPRDVLCLGLRIKLLGQPVLKALEYLGYKEGLSQLERQYLKLLNGNDLSLANLCSMLQLEEDAVTTLEDRLWALGYIEMSSKGRSLSLLGTRKVRALNGL